MLEIFGESYYIDLDEVSNTVNVNEPVGEDSSEQSINLVSFEVVKMMLEIIMTEREELDNNLGIHSANKLSIPFKIAFNTLLKHNIIKHF